MMPMRSATSKTSEEPEAQRPQRNEATPRRRKFAAHAPNGPGPEVPGNTPVETPQETPDELPVDSPEEHPDSVPPQSPPNPPPEMPEWPRSDRP
jgi:fused signal recognition particle receptor